MYPSSKKPFFGAFVKEQVRCLNSFEYDIKVIGDKGEGSGRFQIWAKYILLLIRSLTAAIIFKPDIIHAHYIFPPGFIAWICSTLTGAPLVITSHRGDIFVMPYLSRLIFKVTHFCLLKATKIIAVSKEIKVKMITDYNVEPEKISVIDMGVRLPVQLNHIKNDNMNKKKKIKVIFIAISFERKGGYVILESAKELAQKFHRDIIWEFIGEKPEGIDNLIKDKGLMDHVYFKGYLTHKDTLNRLKSADIFVLPSFSEGLPIAMLEAMSFGLGVIITPVGDVSSVIKDGENGLLVGVDDHKALTNAIIKLVKNKELLNDIGRLARKTAQSYSSHKKAKELSDIYKSCKL